MSIRDNTSYIRVLFIPVIPLLQGGVLLRYALRPVHRDRKGITRVISQAAIFHPEPWKVSGTLAKSGASKWGL